jgi:hypothetical protein
MYTLYTVVSVSIDLDCELLQTLNVLPQQSVDLVHNTVHGCVRRLQIAMRTSGIHHCWRMLEGKDD